MHSDLKRIDKSQSGFTLIELIMVIMLFGIIGTITAVRFESVGMWQKKESLRSFSTLWETLFNEAIATQYGFQLVIDLDSQRYYGLQEIPNRGDDIITQVDYLENLRIKSEQTRRENQELEKAKSNLEEEIAELDKFESGDLESQYFAAAFSDPYQSTRTSPPLDSPSLADPQELASGLKITDVTIDNEKHSEGSVTIRFSPNGTSTFAVVHFAVEESDTEFTLIMNPANGRVTTINGYAEYEWSLAKK